MPGILRRFKDFTQLPAKLAGLLPFLLALAFSVYRGRQFSLIKTLVFFISMLPFEMSVTALNNYMDSKSENAELPFKRSTAKRILIVLWCIAGIAAVLLVFLTDIVVLASGAICIAIGIMYSFGPAPLSRFPFGELFSGIFEGFFIPFLVAYINMPSMSLVWVSLTGSVLQISFNLINIFDLALLSAPAVFGVAAIMLANNICDVESDVRVGRHTLPYYLGTKNSLRLFALLYVAAYLAVIVVSLLRIIPLFALIILPGFFAVLRNIRKFRISQSKEKTFPLSISNFIIVMVPLIAVAAAALIV